MLDLTLGLSAKPHTRAILDGSVQPAGLRLTCINDFGTGGNVGTERHRRILAGELAGGEFSAASLLMARSRGARLTALPVFLARGFCHRSMFCRTDAPIQGPADLRGKHVTVHRYNNTVAVWMRAVLQSEYGVSAEEIHWYVSENDLDGEGAPTGVDVRRIVGSSDHRYGAELVAAGKLDAVLEAFIYEPFAGIRRIVPDHREAEAAWFHRTGALPIFHVLVLQSYLLEQHPWLADSLTQAFHEAQRAAPRFYTESQRAEVDWQASALGRPPDSCTLGECERRSLQMMHDLLLAEGLLARSVEVESVFASGARVSPG